MASPADEARDYWGDKVRLHLCARAVPGMEEWRAMFDRLVTDIVRFRAALENAGNEVGEGDLDPREPLVWAWCVLETMPNDHEQRYQELPETDVEGTGIEDRLDGLCVRGYAMDSPADPVGCITWLAVLTRALDDDLADLVQIPEDPAEWSSTDWLVPGYRCYVVPVKRSHRLRAGRPAQRRALRFHAVIPAELHGSTVSLHLHPNGSPYRDGIDPRDWTLGAAVFPDMHVTREASPASFVLTDAVVPLSEPSILDQQISGAAQERCDLAVWPELTMPPHRLEELRERLAADPLGETTIPLVFAGSWHMPLETGGHCNRCVVLVGDGNPLLTYDKRRRFPWDGLYEGIASGGDIPIIVMDDRLIGLAICRDFCDDIAHDPYRELPLDLLVVPSMGKESTADAHAQRAIAQRNRQGTVIFVVQQVPALAGGIQPQPRPEPPAYSFVAPPAPEAGLSIQQHVPFRVLT